jgi:hypothetical protein
MRNKKNFKSPEDIEKGRREKIRKSIIERYSNGWEAKCGRTNKYDYYSDSAAHIKIDGTWELKTSIYLDSLKLNWKRNKIRFPYINKESKISTYCPDFYIEEWDSYLEIKGYETDLDRLKWSQFKDKLIIWREPDLEKLGILSINIEKYEPSVGKRNRYPRKYRTFEKYQDERKQQKQNKILLIKESGITYKDNRWEEKLEGIISIKKKNIRRWLRDNYTEFLSGEKNHAA